MPTVQLFEVLPPEMVLQPNIYGLYTQRTTPYDTMNCHIEPTTR